MFVCIVPQRRAATFVALRPEGFIQTFYGNIPPKITNSPYEKLGMANIQEPFILVTTENQPGNRWFRYRTLPTRFLATNYYN